MLIVLLLWNCRLNTYEWKMTEKIILAEIICKFMNIEVLKNYIYKLMKKQYCKLNKNCIHNKMY